MTIDWELLNSLCAGIDKSESMFPARLKFEGGKARVVTLAGCGIIGNFIWAVEESFALDEIAVGFHKLGRLAYHDAASDWEHIQRCWC